MKFSQFLIPTLFVFVLFILVCLQHDHHNTRKQRKFHSVSRKKKLSLLPSYPKNPINNDNFTNNGVIFDVMKFGATGNGVTDDTEAFKKAWNVACQAKKPTLLLVPKGHSFMLKSTTFGGPCINSIQFQVTYDNLFSNQLCIYF